MMLKHFKLATALLLLSACFTACSDDDPTPTPSPTPSRGESGFYVVNQGNSYSNIAGSIDAVSFTETDTVQTSGVFSSANGMSLGNSPQKPIIYGSKMYVPMYAENLVWVIDATTMKKIASVQTNQPEAVCGSDGYVFVTNNDGYVTRFDTLSYTSSTPLAVGPNPSGIAASNGKVYAAISDGYNSSNGYADGFKVAQIDAKDFTLDKQITVGMNPTSIVACPNGTLFVVCQGNYADILPKVWKIDRTGNAAAFCDGSLIAVDNQNVTSRTTARVFPLYVLNVVTNWTWGDANYGKTTISSGIYDAENGELVKTDFLPADHMPGSPISMDINPSTRQLFICADASALGYNDPGFVFVYDVNGGFQKKYSVGVHPCGVVFK